MASSQRRTTSSHASPYWSRLCSRRSPAWIARTQLASVRVAFYAALFVCVDIAYNVFEREVLARADATQVADRTRRMARRR